MYLVEDSRLEARRCKRAASRDARQRPYFSAGKTIKQLPEGTEYASFEPVYHNGGISRFLAPILTQICALLLTMYQPQNVMTLCNGILNVDR